MGSGLLLLCSYTRDVAAVLEDGKHAVLWRSEEEMLEKARHYMEHDEERVAIAKRGYEEALSKHTWAHRGKQYRKLIEKYL